MPRPTKRVELVRRLRMCGWTGPFQKGKPPFLIKGSVRLVIPNPHPGDMDWSLTKHILKEAGISAEEWERF